MTTVRRSAPIFSVSDLEAALAHYRRLGFTTRTYAGGGYGYANRDAVEIRLQARARIDSTTTMSVAYLSVDDADALAAEWSAAGVVVQQPVNTEWGQHEGSHVDPDGNLIRFGSPVQTRGDAAES